MVPGESTAEAVSFEWSHHGISSTDSKFTTWELKGKFVPFTWPLVM